MGEAVRRTTSSLRRSDQLDPFDAQHALHAIHAVDAFNALNPRFRRTIEATKHAIDWEEATDCYTFKSEPPTKGINYTKTTPKPQSPCEACRPETETTDLSKAGRDHGKEEAKEVGAQVKPIYLTD